MPCRPWTKSTLAALRLTRSPYKDNHRARRRVRALHTPPGDASGLSSPPRVAPPPNTMAALGSALSTQLRAPSAQWKAKAKRATKARCAPVRAASTENKIEDVAAAVDPKALLPEGLYCESNYKAIRRPTRYARSRRERRRAIAWARETRDHPRDAKSRGDAKRACASSRRHAPDVLD